MNVPAQVLADALCLLEVFESATTEASRKALPEATQAVTRLRVYFNEHTAAETMAPPAAPEPDWRSKWPEDWPACVTAGCREPASFSFNWPGKGRLCACFSCAVRVLNVGDACGLDAKALELVYLPAVKP